MIDACRPRGGPCARSPPRCAASPSRWSSRPEAPARARRTACRAPVRPTLTSIFSSRVCACCAGNLNAIAQRGNFEVVPSRSRSARSSTLMTTPSVSNSSVCRRSRPTRGRTRRPASMPAQRRQCGSTGRPQRLQSLAASRRATRRAGERPLAGPAVGRPADRRTRRSRALRHQRRIQVAHRARRRRCAGWRTAARRRPRARG